MTLHLSKALSEPLETCLFALKLYYFFFFYYCRECGEDLRVSGVGF